MFEIPEMVRAKAVNAGARDWLAGLHGLVADLERDWEIRVGQVYSGATEAFVADVVRGSGDRAVLKIPVPRAQVAAHEIVVLELCAGRGCVQILDRDYPRGALLLERLGPSLRDLSLPFLKRQGILCAAARRVWRPAPDSGLPTGEQRGRALIDYLTVAWDALGRPCSEQAVEHAVACATRRIKAHDDERAVLVHGDVHQCNTLQSGGGFTLVDPDGALAEPEFDLGVLMREDPLDLSRSDPHRRARMLAAWTGLDATAIWEWGVVQRVADGLVCAAVDLQPIAQQKLDAATWIAKDFSDECRP